MIIIQHQTGEILRSNWLIIYKRISSAYKTSLLALDRVSDGNSSLLENVADPKLNLVETKQV